MKDSTAKTTTQKPTPPDSRQFRSSLRKVETALAKQSTAASLLQATDALAIVSGGNELLVYCSIPPEFALLDAETERLLQEANDLVIDTTGAEAVAAELRTQAKRENTDIEQKMRLPVSRKVGAAKTTIDDIFRNATDGRKKVVEIVEEKLRARKAVLLAEAEAERKLKEEVQRKEREKEERLAREAQERANEQERLAQEARDKAAAADSDEARKAAEKEARRLEQQSIQNTEKAAERLQRAEMLSGNVIVEDRRLNLGGHGHETAGHEALVHDKEAFILAVAAGEVPNGFDLLDINTPKLGVRADDLKMAMQYPGITVRPRTGFASSKRR